VRNLNQQKFKTFLPLCSSSSRQNSNFMDTRKPLFPGYMFVEFDRSNTDWYKINNTYGVSKLITFNSNLKSVPKQYITDLVQRYDSSDKELSHMELEAVDQVKVLNGPFTNFISIVETVNANDHIWILMYLMGRKTKIEANVKTYRYQISSFIYIFVFWIN